MSKEIQDSINEVVKAIEGLNEAFEKKAQDLARENNREQLEKWTTAARAMQDSGNIYLTWAKHYGGLAEDEGDRDLFLEEGMV